MILKKKQTDKISVRDPNTGKFQWSYHVKRENERVKQRYLRKCWRLRYGNQFKKDQLYIIDKAIHRYGRNKKIK